MPALSIQHRAQTDLFFAREKPYLSLIKFSADREQNFRPDFVASVFDCRQIDQLSTNRLAEAALVRSNLRKPLAYSGLVFSFFFSCFRSNGTGSLLAPKLSYGCLDVVRN
jgi:hypothetical protein